MPNTGGYFSETLSNTKNNNNNSKILTKTNQTPPKTNRNNPLAENTNAMEVDVEDEVKQNDEIKTLNNENQSSQDEEEDDNDEGHFDERLVVDYACNLKQDEDDLVSDLILPYNDEVLQHGSLKPQDLNTHASTPKSSKTSKKQLINLLNEEPKLDGKILTDESTNDFQQNANISPIYCGPVLSVCSSNEENPVNLNLTKVDNTIALEMDIDDLDNEADLDDAQSDLKRKRESFDSVSLMSMESFAMPASTKKPKLLRTGSITKTIKRSMSFVAVRTPIVKMLRPRRSSVAFESAPNDDNTEDHNENGNDSLCSIASVETTFNESIRKPVIDKFRSLRNRITRSSSRKEKHVLNIQYKSPEKDSVDCQNDREGFKTPKAPSKYATSCSSAPRPITKSISSTSTSEASKLCNKSLNLTQNDIPNFPCLSTSSVSTTCSSNLPSDSKIVDDVVCENANIKSITTTVSTTTSTTKCMSYTTATNTAASPLSNQSIQITNHHQSNVNHNMLNVKKYYCPVENNNELVGTGVSANSAGHMQTVLNNFFYTNFLYFKNFNKIKKTLKKWCKSYYCNIHIYLIQSCLHFQV